MSQFSCYGGFEESGGRRRGEGEVEEMEGGMHQAMNLVEDGNAVDGGCDVGVVDETAAGGHKGFP